MFEVIDRKTGGRVGGAYTTMHRARARVNALDAAYGGYRYYARPIAVVHPTKGER